MKDLERRIEILLKKYDEQVELGFDKNIAVIAKEIDKLLIELDGHEIKLKTSKLH